MLRVTTALISVLVLCAWMTARSDESVSAERMDSEPIQNEGITDASTVSVDSSFAETLRGLRSPNAAAAADALRTLASNTQMTRSNLSFLLEEARTANEAPASGLANPLTPGTQCPTWWPAGTNGSLLAAVAADSIRGAMEEDESEKALAIYKPFINDAIRGKTPGVCPEDALKCYYHCVFEPPDMPLAPAESPAIEDIIQCLRMSLRHTDADVRNRAAFLLSDAAYVMPDRREELLGYISAELGKKKGDERRGYVEHLLRNGEEVVPRERFVIEIQQKSENELADWLMERGGAGSVGQVYSQVLAQRLASSPNRTAIVMRLLSNPDIARFSSGYYFPGPTPEDASETDKEFVDKLILFLQREITKAEYDLPAKHEWAVYDLGGLVVDDPMKLKETQLRGAEVPVPYATDRVVLVLLQALGSKERSVQRLAAGVLGDICWISEDAARAALTGLTAIRDQIEQNFDISRPDSEFPQGGSWSERPEKYVHDGIVASIREAEMALKLFQEGIGLEDQKYFYQAPDLPKPQSTP